MFRIRDGIFSRTFFWDYVQNLDQCVPGCKASLVLVKEKADTSTGMIASAGINRAHSKHAPGALIVLTNRLCDVW
jgi:hypothetical protein